MRSISRVEETTKAHGVCSSTIHDRCTVHDELFLLLGLIKRERSVGSNIIEGCGDITRSCCPVILAELKGTG